MINSLSVLLGILPESIFFTLFFIFAKQLKKYRIALFLMIFVLNLGVSLVFAYTIYYHIISIFGMYLILYGLYQSHVIDVFLATSSYLVLAIFGFLCYYGINDYLAAYVVNRLLLVLFLVILHDKLSFFYTVYKNMWNVSDKSKIKSITVRNVSCVMFNVLVFLACLAIVVVPSR